MCLRLLEAAAGGANKRTKIPYTGCQGNKEQGWQVNDLQPCSFGVDGYLQRPMAPRYTRREFSALERGLLRLLEETG